MAEFDQQLIADLGPEQAPDLSPEEHLELMLQDEEAGSPFIRALHMVASIKLARMELSESVRQLADPEVKMPVLYRNLRYDKAVVRLGILDGKFADGKASADAAAYDDAENSRILDIYWNASHVSLQVEGFADEIDYDKTTKAAAARLLADIEHINYVKSSETT